MTTCVSTRCAYPTQCINPSGTPGSSSICSANSKLFCTATVPPSWSGSVPCTAPTGVCKQTGTAPATTATCVQCISNTDCATPKTCDANNNCVCPSHVPPYTDCTTGAKQCGSTTTVQTCTADGACNYWATTATCTGTTPLCQQAGDTATCVCTSGSCGAGQSCNNGVCGTCSTNPPAANTITCNVVQAYTLCSGATGSVTGTKCNTGETCAAAPANCQACVTTAPKKEDVTCGYTVTYYLCGTPTQQSIVGTKCGGNEVCNQGSCISSQCTPGATTSCYDGPAGTAGVGICHAGTRTCSATGTWGDCENQQTPSTETCNTLDDDCDGTVNDGDLCPAYQYCTSF